MNAAKYYGLGLFGCVSKKNIFLEKLFFNRKNNIFFFF